MVEIIMASPLVLFVTGDARIRVRLDPLLRAAHFYPIDVTSAPEARSALRMLSFPVVIIDWAVDDADGVKLCHEIHRREKESGARPYLLLLSDRGDPDDIAKGLAAGAEDCLSMSSSDAELSAQLRRATTYCLVQGLSQ